jgi:DNA polymerase-3 subunit delta'
VAKPRGLAGALSDLEKRQRSRATRTQRDALDRALVDLAAFYRDVLVVQLGSAVDLVNADLDQALTRLAAASTPETTLRRIEAVLAAREAIDANVAPLLAIEAMALTLHTG